MKRKYISKQIIALELMAVIMFALLTLSACDSGDEKLEEPEEPEAPLYKLKGAVKGSFSIGTLSVENVHNVGLIIEDDSTGHIYSIGLSKADKGYGDNATMTLSEVDVVLPESNLYWEIGNDPDHPNVPAEVVAKPTKMLSGVIEFYPNWKEEEWFLDSRRYYDLRKIEFTATEVSLWESGRRSKEKLRYLYENPSEFSKILQSMLKNINDVKSYEEGSQAMSFYVSVYKYGE